MLDDKLLPRSPALKKVVRAIFRKAAMPPEDNEAARLEAIYASLPAGQDRRAMRAVLMQMVKMEPPEPKGFIPMELPEPEPEPIPEPEPEPEPEPAPPPKPSKPKKASSMMSLDLSDATMMLQFGGGDEPEEEEPEPVVAEPDPMDEQVVKEVQNELDQSTVAALDASGFSSSDDWDPFGEKDSDTAWGAATGSDTLAEPVPAEEAASDDEWDPFAESAEAAPETGTASIDASDDWDPFAEDTTTEPVAEPAEVETPAPSSSFDDWDPFADDTTDNGATAEQVAEPEPEVVAEPPAPKKKKNKATDLSALSGNSALFDQLGGGFSDMD